MEANKLAAVLSVAVGLALAASAESVTCVWTGRGNDGLWSTDANWQDNRKPASGDAVVLEVASGEIVNDLEGLTLSSLQMTATGKLSFGTKTKLGKVLRGQSPLIQCRGGCLKLLQVGLEDDKGHLPWVSRGGGRGGHR